MKKLIPVLLTALRCASPVYSATNNWTAGIAVTQSASGIRLNTITINALGDGKIVVSVAWSWLDAQGKVVRSGVTRYTQDQIDAKLRSKGASVDTFRSLFLAIAQEEAAR